MSRAERAPRSPEAVALSPERASEDRRAADGATVDVLVVGGGIVGAGVALDAATRGLSVVLLEASDWAAGTSSRSSRLVHGGLRYIRNLELGLVREALRERGTLLETAPHLVRPVRFLYPLRHRIERPYVGAGVGLYDLLARLPGTPGALPRGRHLSARAARAELAGLRPDRVRGAVSYYDAQVDDARLVLTIVRTAASYGARVLSRTRVVELLEEDGRVVGARAEHEDGTGLAVRARAVVVAAGPWTEQLAAMAGARGARLQPSKGVHLVVSRDAIDLHAALIAPTAKSVLFILPWGEHWIIGTTDTAWEGEPDHPVATAADVDYLLAEVNALVARPLARSAVESVFVGLRPLLAGDADSTAKLSREHAVVAARPGLTLVAGGKLTTYRVMARDALDVALRDAAIAAGPCRTRAVALVGAGGADRSGPAPAGLARSSGLPEAEIDRLVGRYGGLVTEVLASTSVARPTAPLVGAPGYLRAEVGYAVTHEGALHLEDVLCRRTRLAVETPDRGRAACEEVAAAIAPLLGWGDRDVAAEIAAYEAAASADDRAVGLEASAS